MDLTEWNSLTRTEKERVWDTLSEAEKDVIRKQRRSGQSRGSRTGRRSRAPATTSVAMLGVRGSMGPLLFRIAASVAALTGAALMFFDIPLLNERVLLLLLLAACTAGVALVVEHLAAVIEEMRELNSRISLRETNRAAAQLSKKEMTDESTSDL